MSRHASPTAQLLRNSRLFSIPQPLPKPIYEQPLREGLFKTSDSATTQYPTRQAVITPASSRSRGDYGLKRALPKRGIAARSSDPVHNIIGNDTYEGITEYESAAKHVRTLERFRELNIGLTRQDRATGVRESKISAMEPSLDFTDPETGGQRRWKYAGGGVRSMTPAEFEQYLDTAVKGRKEEFSELLRARMMVDAIEAERDAEKEAMREAPREGEMKQVIDHDELQAKSTYVDWLVSMRETNPQGLVEYLSAATKEIATPLEYTSILEYTLRERWWTQRLEEEASAEADELRLRLQNATYTSAPSLPLPIRNPAGNADATTWIKHLNFISQLEGTFLTSRSSPTFNTDFQTYLRTLKKDTTTKSTIMKILRSFLDLPPLASDMRPSTSSAVSASGLPNILKGGEPQFALSTHPSAGLSYLRTNTLLHNHPILGPQKSDPPIRARVIGKTDGSTYYGVAGFVAKREQGSKKMDLDVEGGAKGERKVRAAWVDGEGRVVVSTMANGDNEGRDIRDGRLEPQSIEERMQRVRTGELMHQLGRGAIAAGSSASDSRAGAGIGKRRAPRAEGMKSEAVDRLRSLERMISGNDGGMPASDRRSGL